MHTLVYFFLPQPEFIEPLSYTNQINSYDDFFIEKVLHIPDKTPCNESDDIERILQIVHVEDFFKKVSYKYVYADYPIQTKVFVTFDDTRSPSTSLDVLIPPPKA
jgi:hypothetical protein